MDLGWFFIGIGVAAPICIGATLWLNRRIWKNARRMASKAKGQEHFIRVGHLVGGLAHEIKNPLSTVHVNLQLLSEDLSRYEDEEHRRIARRLESVRKEADRVKDILDDFLRYAGKVELSLSKTDLRQVLEELLDFFAPQAEVSGVVMRSSLPETPVYCRIDVNLIKQSVMNLMINAVQAMPDGGELLIRLSPQRRKAVIEVIDTGAGIDPGTCLKIFHAYFSTKKDGSGLGLPTTQRIIQEHNGDIRVESELGKGTRFIVTLPLSES
jgi:signal transduction histidine kinase